MQRLITIDELGQLLNLSRSGIFRLKREGLPSVKISHKVVRYDYDEVLKWLKERSQNAR